ncbi:NaeI family type II restriction endonuclease [Actinokineospora sp. G85]|uniref:NaeI family type II restriction endonuclease n=1 Tax=Actinokineospora sp. G85 TaxID=3406626 RepID=UPI003C753C78
MPPDAAQTSDDTALADVVSWFQDQTDMEGRFGTALRRSLDEVIDGQRTGRYDVRTLEKTEKTYLGTKIEIVIRSEFDLMRGTRLDYRIADHEVDCKFSLTGGWTIPQEAVGQLCLLTTARDHQGTFDIGIIRAVPEVLNVGANQDKKRTIKSTARRSIVWLTRSAPLPSNLLLTLPPSTVEAIMQPKSGQQRINELLRQVQGRVIQRNTAVTVARQQDGLKRCRDARKHLRTEGIVVLGHQNESPIIAQALGLPVPPKGAHLAVRLVHAVAEIDRRTVLIDGKHYAVARPADPVEPAPSIRC